MVILGLGTNQGNRLGNFREALAQLKNHPAIQVKKISPIYQSDALLPVGAPADWNKPFYNCAIACDTTLSPSELLVVLKNVEKKLGRISSKHWSPRIIDIDILSWHDHIIQQEKLTIPHKNLTERPFALWPLRDLAPDWIHPVTGKSVREYTQAWGSVYTGDAPFQTKQILSRADTPQIVAILNLTDNSFTADGVGESLELAIEKAQKFYEQGAEIIDIGAQATNPDTRIISPEQEWQRLAPVIAALKKQWKNNSDAPFISIDTYSPWVAAQAIAEGVDWINDVSGLTQTDMQKIIADASVKIVMMHNLGLPAQRQHLLPRDADVVKIIKAWQMQQIKMLEKSAIALDRVIFDVGIGFGKNAEQSLELLQHIQEFMHPAMKLFVGYSRKSVGTRVKDIDYAQRDAETIAVSLYLAQQGVDYLRVHDVVGHVLALNAWAKFQ